MDVRVAYAHGTVLIFDSLKTSSINNVRGYFESKFQINVTFYQINTYGQTLVNLPFL